MIHITNFGNHPSSNSKRQYSQAKLLITIENLFIFKFNYSSQDFGQY